MQEKRIEAMLTRMSEQSVIDNFHKLFYDGPAGEGHIFEHTYWFGVPVFKNPLDLHIYQEILWEVRPDLIIETGTYKGGSALYLAHILDLIGKGEIITIDIQEHERPSHPRITYLHGSSTDPETLKNIRGRLSPEQKCMVILDSDHSQDHVFKEMTLLASYVSIGSYLIVEDSNINGNPALPEFGPGPAEAIQAFLKYDLRFQVDMSREKFLVTFNPGGYLKRVC